MAETGNPSFPSALNEEHRMLLTMRDTLYEGNWSDFEADLSARAHGRPHVFVTVETSPAMVATIRRHLELISEMRQWEETSGARLSA